jgi:soluble lytic murein transglycosylase
MLWLHRIRFYSFIVLILLCCVIPLGATYTNIVKKEHITKQITEHLKNENSAIGDDTAKLISRVVYEESANYGLDYRLILALMKIESNFQYDAVSSRGARGLLQVKPSLAKFIAQDLGIRWDGHNTLDKPDTNLKIGICFFSRLIKDFENINLALKAYNIGPSKVKELLENNTKPTSGFPGLVINEYNKNTSTLPNP